MQSEPSFFSNIKPQFLTLETQLSSVFCDVSILVENSSGRTFRYSKSGIQIREHMFSNAGAVIRYTPKGSTRPLEYSFNNFTPAYMESIPSILVKYAATCVSPDARFSEEQQSTGAVSSNVIKDKMYRSSQFRIHPANVSPELIVHTLERIYREAVDFAPEVIDCVCTFQYVSTHKIYLSSAKEYEQHLLWSNGTVQPMAKRNEKTYYYHQTFSTQGGAELLEDMKHGVSHACQCALDLLDSTPPPAGEYDVICTPEVTGLIAHEAFGHGVEMDMFVKNRALAKDYIGKRVASPLVTMHDNAASCAECGSYFFDDEGTPSSDTIIIQNGILMRGMNDKQSSEFCEVPATGNSRRESFERKAYVRMTNTYFEPGTSKLEDMIASVKHGILLENASSGMEDPKNWGIQCMVNLGREIRDGKLTGKVFSPVCLSGTVPELLSSISMVSDTSRLYGSGYCGKGYKEWVKVSDGGPYIKCRVHIS